MDTNNIFNIDEMDSIIALFLISYRKRASKAAKSIQDNLNKGLKIEIAINTALSVNGFYAGVKKDIVNSQYKLFGSTDLLVDDKWATDGLTLEDRIDIMNKNIVEHASKSIAMKNKAIDDLTKSLKKGMDDKSLVKNMPKYMNDLVSLYKKVATGDVSLKKQYESTLKEAQKKINRIDELQEGSRQMKQAYKVVAELTSNFDKVNQEAMKKSIEEAVGARGAYYANRILVTELARLNGEMFFNEYQNDDNVKAYRWTLGPMHIFYDICDVHAKSDLFNLGAGVYPKNGMPEYPAHPHCRCRLSPVYENELHESKNAGTYDRDSMIDFIDNLSDKDKKKLMGEKGMDEYQRTRNFEKVMRNYSGYNKPKTRFDKNK